MRFQIRDAATLILALWAAPSVALAADETPPQCPGDGLAREPFVQSEATAKEIFLAIARARAAHNMKKYPVIQAKDEGDHWEVRQASKNPSPIFAHGVVTTIQGGGQFALHIDKCSGAISNAHFEK
ncbi:hypothetical protein GCM10008941_35490 [Rhizomicrobium palustre]